MTFQTLAIISLVGLLGPLLATPPRWRVPVMLGELLAGILVGQAGLGLVDSSDPTLTLLADVGFALIMFVAGTHVPVRDAGIRSALGRGAGRAGLAAVIAVVLGVATSAIATCAVTCSTDGPASFSESITGSTSAAEDEASSTA